MRQCTKCEETKTINEFSKKKNSLDGYNRRCKTCTREASRDHYLANKQYYIDKASVNRRKVNEWYQEYKGTLHCSRCPEDHVSTLEFHHPDPSKKDGNISEIVVKGSRKNLLSEIDKCEVLCSNCHRKHHWNEKQTMPL